MTRQLPGSVAAELIKLRTLPAAVATVLGTIAAAIVLAAALTATARPDAITLTGQTVPYLQVGPILLGVLAATTEYEGSQIRATLTAVPDRLVALAGKSVAYLAVAAATSGAALAAALGTAWVGLGALPAGVSAWPVAGAAVYLVLVGLLAHALAVLLRSLIPALVAVLVLVLVVSPLLTGLTQHARWLPDQAGRLLYLPDADAVLTPWTGTLVLAAWIAAVATAATAAFLTRDA